MRYLIEPKERRRVNGYEFASFVKNIGENLSVNMVKQSWSDK